MRPALFALVVGLVLCAPVGGSAEAQGGGAQAPGGGAPDGDTDPTLLLDRGLAAARAGAHEEAAGLFRRALEREPAWVAAGHHLGVACLRLGRFAEGRRVLAAMARLAPGDARLQADLGRAYLAEGNLAWAVRSLRAAAELDPRDERTRYHLGLALARLGEPDDAARELAAARHGPGLDWRSLRLQRALALYQARRFEESRRLLDPLLGRRGQTLLAGRILRAGYEAEGVPASWVTAELVASAIVDTNALYEHETTAPPAVGPGVAGSLTLRPLVTSRFLLWGELAGARAFYFPASASTSEREVGDASRTDARASAAAAYRWPRPAGAMQVSLAYGFGLTFLDGAPPLADRHHIFVEQHAAHLTLQHDDRVEGALSQVRYTLGREEYADLPRSNTGNELSLEHARSFLEGRGKLLGWLGLRHEAARSADYEALVPGGGLGFSFLGPWGLVLGSRVGYEHENHFRSANGRWGKQRLDNTLDVMAEVGRALFWGLRLRAVYERVQNWSTVPDFDYGRDLVSLNLSWSTS